MPQQSSRPVLKDRVSRQRFNHTALGGTFDYFHKGHRIFLKKAFAVSRKVTIGITEDDLARKIHDSTQIQSLSERKMAVEEFLKTRGFTSQAKIITLHDPFGITTTDETLEALLVTSMTMKRGGELNRKRRQNGLSALKLVRCQLVMAEDDKLISSRRIREGEITREGVRFMTALLKATPVRLPTQLRSAFREPFGTVIPANAKKIDGEMREAVKIIDRKQLHPIICVGDIVTLSMLKLGKTPRISIVDLRVKRVKRYQRVSELGPIGHLPRYKVANPAGTITKKLVKLVHKAMNKKSSSVILVEGEEDLAVLPCVLLAPLDAIVLYGHFQYGIIAVEVSEEKKSEALKLLQQLKRMAELDA
ncbi:pantetheine-phosphate adenylyltransferase [Patescibacteria group bacterium]|nr:pantetheine-phosphate adenylyltransferase [Patescibacteria group bacterium]